MNVSDNILCHLKMERYNMINNQHKHKSNLSNLAGVKKLTILSSL